MASALSRARARYMANPTNRGLRWYLILKGRSGVFDKRMCAYNGCSSNVVPGVKKFIARAFGAGLVPTFTIEGQHAPGSYHGRRPGRAADIGLRKDEIGTSRGRRKLIAFQKAEYKRAHRTGAIEIIGPHNSYTILRGNSTRLAEGTPLETQHDTHVHEAHR